MKKTVLLTGATGYIGRALVERLRHEGLYNLSILTRDPDRARERLKFGNSAADVRLMTYEEIAINKSFFADGDVLIHLGFARPYMGEMEIAKSLETTRVLFEKAYQSNISSVINISSRSVYGDSPQPWTEQSQVNPNTAYGKAKFESEKLLQNLGKLNPEVKSCSLRLCTVTGAQSHEMDMYVVNKFASLAAQGEPLNVSGRQQEIEFLDVHDVTNAILKILDLGSEKWKPVYNVGPNQPYTLEMIANTCVKEAAHINKGIMSKVCFNEISETLNYVMDSSTFIIDTGWKPRVSMEKTIQQLVAYYWYKSQEKNGCVDD